jgi:chromosome segregation ATPase
MIPQEQPDQDHDASLFVEPEAVSAPDLKSAIEHFWTAVRKSAEVIVTLRQENSMLQSNLAVRKAAEEELLLRVDQLLVRIEELERDRAEQQTQIDTAPAIVTVDTSQIEDLQATIRELTENLEQARAHHEAHGLEREALEHRLLELERAATITESSSEELTALQDEVLDLRQQLDQAMAIIERYRTAGLRHLEDPETEHQMALFGAAAARQLVTEEELTELARRLDTVADRVSELLGIS